MRRDKKSRKTKNKFSNISLTTLGWEMALPIFGGALLGFHLDKTFMTNHVLTFVFLIVGIMVGYYNLIKLIQLELLRAKSSKYHKERNRSRS